MPILAGAVGLIVVAAALLVSLAMRQRARRRRAAPRATGHGIWIAAPAATGRLWRCCPLEVDRALLDWAFVGDLEAFIDAYDPRQVWSVESFTDLGQPRLIHPAKTQRAAVRYASSPDRLRAVAGRAQQHRAA